jgi:hypothetical protein
MLFIDFFNACQEADYYKLFNVMKDRDSLFLPLSTGILTLLDSGQDEFEISRCIMLILRYDFKALTYWIQLIIKKVVDKKFALILSDLLEVESDLVQKEIIKLKLDLDLRGMSHLFSECEMRSRKKINERKIYINDHIEPCLHSQEAELDCDSYV